jgi:hypothetical protein
MRGAALTASLILGVMMKNFTVKIRPRGFAPYSLTIIAQRSIDALRTGLATMQAVGSISVRLA